MFHGMDACTAFSFTLSGQSNLAHSGFRTIAQETQVRFSCYFLLVLSACPQLAMHK